MKLTVLKEHLNDSIQHVSKAITSRTTIPILSGIKIETTTEGITLTASDTDISIQSFIPAEENNKSVIQLEREGSVVLPAKFFVEIIRKLPSDEIEIEVKDNFFTVIKSGSSEIQMVGLDPEEYPLLPKIEEQEVFTIPSEILKTMIRQTVFAVSPNESTPILTGVLFQVENGQLKLIGCDRHRLASREVAIDHQQLQSLHNIVISGKTLNELSKIIPDQNHVIDIVVSDNQVLFRFSSILFYTRILDGTYPDTSKIIPQTYQTEIVVNTKQFTDAIDRAYLLSREEKTNIVKLVMEDNQQIEIFSSSNELGKVTEQIEAKQVTGESLKISFNSKYMLDALKVIDSENICIGFTGAMSPIIIKPGDDVQMLHMILPYRTTG